MDNYIAHYVDKLNQNINETDATSNINLLHDVLNAEYEKKGKSGITTPQICSLLFVPLF